MSEYQAEIAAAATREFLRRRGQSALVSSGGGNVRVFAMFGRQNGWVHKASYNIGSVFGLRRIARDLSDARSYAAKQDKKDFAHV